MPVARRAADTRAHLLARRLCLCAFLLIYQAVVVVVLGSPKQAQTQAFVPVVCGHFFEHKLSYLVVPVHAALGARSGFPLNRRRAPSCRSSGTEWVAPRAAFCLAALDPCNAGFKKELGPRVPRSGLPLKPEARTQRTPRALRFRENAKPLHECRGSEWPRALPQPPTPAGKLRDVLVPGSELGRHLAAVDQ